MTLLSTWYTYYHISGTNNPTTQYHYDDWRFYFQVYLDSQSVIDNTSTIKIYCYLQYHCYHEQDNPSDGWQGTTATYGYVKVDTTWYETSKILTGAMTGSYLIGIITRTLSHDTQGYRSFAFQGNGKLWIGQTDRYTSATTITLPTIPRASTVTATDANIESATSININRASSSFTHSLYYSFVGIAKTLIASDIATSYGWTIPTDFYAQIPNAKNGTCTIYCDTYSGATLIGSSTTTFKASVNETTNAPDVSATITDTNALTTALTGDSSKIVKYISNARVQITATAKNSATISSVKVTCGDGKTSTSADSTLNAVESGTFTVEATDSRGIKNTATYNQTLIDYIKLTLNPTLYRTSPTNNEIAIALNGNFFNDSFGVTSNSLVVKYRFKEKGTETWGDYVTLSPTISGNAYSLTETILGNTFDYQKAYDFEVVAEDEIYKSATSIVFPYTVSQGLPNYWWNVDSFTHETDVFIGLKNILDIMHPVNSIYMTVDNTNPNTILGFGTWVAWGSGSVPVGVDANQTEFNTVEKTGGSKTNTLVASNIPPLPGWYRQVDGTGTEYVAGISDSYEGETGVGRSISRNSSVTAVNNLQPYITCYMWKRTA